MFFPRQVRLLSNKLALCFTLMECKLLVILLEFKIHCYIMTSIVDVKCRMADT